MPLPDTNNWSSRIYELLKETDLENLSYAQFQGVAEKLFIEPENEDEMRRLVLVQLARMAVRGDWDGFLTGGGGSGAPTDAEYVVMSLNGTLTNERVLTAGSGISITDGGAGSTVTIASTSSGGGILPGAGDMGSTFDTLMASGGLFGGNTMSSSTFTWNDSKVYFVPIVFPKAQTISNIQYSITGGSFTGTLGLYSSGTNGSPDSVIVSTSLQSGVGSGYYSAGFAGTAVTANTLYWIGLAQGDTSSSVNMRAMKNDAQGGNYVMITDISNFNALQLRTSTQVGTDSGLPATITTSGLEGLYGLHPMLGVGF